MRRQILGAASLAVLGVVSLGIVVEARAGNWADSLFSERGINFGAVPRGAKVRHPFVLTNRLREPVNILDVHASCGCTTGRASTTLVPAGGTAVIEAEMDTRNFVGRKATTLSVTLVTASGSQAVTQLGVESNILADIVFNPGSADFGAVGQGQTPEQVITVERLGNPDWRFTRMIASDNLCRMVQADLVETYRSSQGVGYNLVIRLKSDAPAGYLREEIRLITNDRESPSVPVLVTAQIQGGLSVSPSLLALGSVAAGGKAQGRFLVKGTQPFTIQAIEGNGDGFTLSAPDSGDPKALHVLSLSFDPASSSLRGDLTRRFRVTTSLAGEAPLELTATVKAAP